VGVLCGNLGRDRVTYVDRPYQPVLSMMPTKYEDIWTAAKGLYKLEPIIADGGELIIYAPHITQVSAMHPIITEIGYPNRDYFLGQWDKFRNRPWGDSAHSSHLRGQGRWDPEHREQNRVAVTLATGIPRTRRDLR
jgi:nickel-dependent lactate racemase